MRFFRNGGALAAVALAAFFSATPVALADRPHPWQMGLQEFVTEGGHRINWFHNLLNTIIFVIALFVLALLVYVVWRFNEKANPVPSKTTHNMPLEVAWTVLPIIILLMIAFPSFRLLRYQLVVPSADLVVKVTGHSWRWEYEYPKEYCGFSFVSTMLQEDDRKKDKPNEPRLLAVSDELVVPINKNVIVQVTASDVLHAFAVPAFGIKIDAVPGRLNQTWFNASKEGLYYGQCSELCGRDHAFMPIAVRVVSQEAYDKWLEEAKKKYAALDDGTRLARAVEAAR